MIDQPNPKTEKPPAPLRWSQLPSALALSCAMALGLSAPAEAAGTSKAAPPDILFIGDSHLSFGAGKAFREFFRDFEKHCKPHDDWMGHARAISMRSFGLMGVKSTAPYHWVSHSQKYKKMICEPDPKWPVNARLYGFSHHADGSYVQLGRDPSFPFCRPEKSALEAVFEWDRPNLLILYFTGNTIERWARSRRTADLDVKRMMKQMPKDVGCVFMTTSPVYHKKHNELRVKAQKNIGTAFAEHGSRCKFVPMLTPRTIAAIEGKARYFRRHKDGRVKDPYHPGLRAARLLLKTESKPFCQAVMSADSPRPTAKAE